MTPPNRRSEAEMDALAARSMDCWGRCGWCDLNVSNVDPNHRVTPILAGGRGVECALRGDYEPEKDRSPHA